MKVKEFLKKMNMSSNCPVQIYDVNNNETKRIFYAILKEENYGEYGGMKLNSFSIRDNKLIIYAE